MALTPVFFLVACCLSSVVSSSSAGCSQSRRSFTSIFTLGDSYIDTGNFVIMAAPVIPVLIDKPPYGITFNSAALQGAPATEGPSQISWAAEAFGIPFLPASLANSSDVSRGVNFAVGGATAIDVGLLREEQTP